MKGVILILLRKTKLMSLLLLTVLFVGCGKQETETGTKIVTVEQIENSTSFAGVTATVNNMFTIENINETETIEKADVVEVAEPQYTTYSVPTNNSFKSYMDCSYITDVNSKQYAFKFEYLCSASGIMLVDGRYVIALGSYYTTNIGNRVDLVMENGAIVECIIGDVKADKDTDSTNRQHSIDNSVVEFIVATDFLSDKVRTMGDCSYADERLIGEIKEIRVYDEIMEGVNCEK